MGLTPNEKTCAILLNACNHSGDVEIALDLWNNVITERRVKYDRFVMTSLIDCVTRKGMVKKGKDLVSEYESYWKDNGKDGNHRLDNEAMWMILLNACKMRGDDDDGGDCAKREKLTGEIYQEIQKRFGDDKERMAAAAVILSNVYAESSNIKSG